MEDLDSRILQWLDKTGFPLEMEAAASFREAGFYVGQSSSFHDPEAGKSREIDVLAEFADIFSLTGIFFSVECKSGNKPWVVLTARTDDSFVGIGSYCIQSKAVREISFEKGFYDPNEHHPFIKRTNFYGYSLRQAFSEKNDIDPAYSAAMSVLKSCNNLKMSHATFLFAFPVIVIDTPLFECIRSNKDGKLKVRRVNESEFSFSAHLPTLVNSRINVITRDSLPKFTCWAKEMATKLKASMEVEEKAHLAKMRAGT